MPNDPLIFTSDVVVASPAAALETVVCAVPGVTTRWGGQPINLSGWVNVTPDASATALVLRVRRTKLTGTLCGVAQTVSLGASAGGGAVIGTTADQVSADAPTAVPADGAPHNIPCVVAAPPTWLDGASNITEAGLYEVFTVLAEVGAIATPGQYIHWGGPDNGSQIVSVDGMGATGATVAPMEAIALGAADLPFSVVSLVTTPTDATASFTAQTSVVRLAAPGGAVGPLSPADAVTDVLDTPGSLAGGTYVLTAQMTGAAGASTINGASLTATVD